MNTTLESQAPSAGPTAVPSAMGAMGAASGGADGAAPGGFTDAESLWQALQKPAGTREAHLGQALIAHGLIDAALMERALVAQSQSRPHRLLGEMLVAAGAITAAQLRDTLARWLGLVVVDPRRVAAEPAALQLVPRALAEREGVLPLLWREGTLVVAMTDPWDQRLLAQLRMAGNARVLPVEAVPGTLPGAIARAYAGAAAAAPAPAPRAADVPAAPRRVSDLHSLAEELAESARVSGAVADLALEVSESDNTLVRLVNRLIADAVEHGASDIHIETAEPPRPVRARLRIDGELVPWIELPAQCRFALVARLKIMAALDIAEHRKPQDGKIEFARHGGAQVELRMVTVPTTHGLEDVVLRLLGGLEPIPLEKLGLSAPNLAALRGVIHKAYGLVLICGPTGCGKTTTLHSVMRELNTDARKIWTAEDPVEITQPGLRQVQVNARIGWTFAAAMRTFLRADPDIIMIGEMRDEETARIAVEASLTGHLVMSTLHTNSAPESITRLLEIGLDPFMFSDSLLAVLAQRLVRRLCTHCRTAEPMSDGQLQTLLSLYRAGHGATDEPALLSAWRQRHAGPDGRLRVWRAPGCKACGGTGYAGRIGLHELVVVDETLRGLIRQRAGLAELQGAARGTGMSSVRQDGIEKVLAGHTDLREVLTATNQ